MKGATTFHLKIQAVEWMRSFLIRRHQRAYLNVDILRWSQISSDIPKSAYSRLPHFYYHFIRFILSARTHKWLIMTMMSLFFVLWETVPMISFSWNSTTLPHGLPIIDSKCVVMNIQGVRDLPAVFIKEIMIKTTKKSQTPCTCTVGTVVTRQSLL